MKFIFIRKGYIMHSKKRFAMRSVLISNDASCGEEGTAVVRGDEVVTFKPPIFGLLDRYGLRYLSEHSALTQDRHIFLERRFYLCHTVDRDHKVRPDHNTQYQTDADKTFFQCPFRHKRSGGHKDRYEQDDPCQDQVGTL